MTSSIATLTVTKSPVIIVQPTNQALAVGSNATFAVTAVGTAPLSYQWQVNGTNLVNVTNLDDSQISGATTNVLTISNVQTSDPTATTTVIVTNLAGSVTSSIVTPDGDEYRAGDHGAANEPDGGSGYDCDLYCHRHRDGAVELPMVDE